MSLAEATPAQLRTLADLKEAAAGDNTGDAPWAICVLGAAGSDLIVGHDTMIWRIKPNGDFGDFN